MSKPMMTAEARMARAVLGNTIRKFGSDSAEAREARATWVAEKWVSDAVLAIAGPRPPLTEDQLTRLRTAVAVAGLL